MSDPQFITSSLNRPKVIALDSCGNLYVTNFDSNTIGKYMSNGTAVNTSLISGLDGPEGIAFDSLGNLYVANFNGNTIGKYTSDGDEIDSSFISGLNYPTFIAFDIHDNLYVSNYGNGRIRKYSSNGSEIDMLFISSGLSSPQGMTFDSYGNLYIANSGSNRIRKYNPNGILINGTFISTGLSNPVGIAFDSYENLYVTNSGDNSVRKYNSNGRELNIPVTLELNGPNGIAFDSAGNLYISNLNDNTIGKYEIPPPPPLSSTCFPAGTLISTNQGQIPIDKINTEIHTIRDKKIVEITQTIAQNKYLVCFEKDSLGINLPSKKTIITKNHCIFYKGKMMQAREFIGKFENVKKIKYTGEILYNVLLEEHDKMMVNNLICETLHPENGIAKLYKDLKNLNQEQQQQFIKKYNEYVIKNKVFSSKKITK
jgi:sugar lactone lactonase YvrE